MALTEKACRDAKPREKVYLLSDGDGLSLEIRPNGKKYWISRIRSGGAEKRRSLGVYPTVPAKEARRRNTELRESGILEAGERFGSIAEEWFQRRAEGRLADSYSAKLRYRLDKYVLPALGSTPIRAVSSADVLAICRAIEDAGIIETAHRIRQLVGQIFRYAIATGRAKNDPTSALYGALTPSKSRHFATFTVREDVQRLLRAIDAYPYPVTRLALFFSVYSFARPGEVRKAEWSEIDSDLWRCPPEKMKGRRPHLVPVSPQLAAVLEALRLFTGHQCWLFPSTRNDGRAMSENTVRAALRSLGFGNDEISPHGFRGMASTILHENGWPTEVVELQLAHADRNAVRASYNHAERLQERREMMNWWGSWLQSLLK